jgi:transcription initiation factor TFIIIB Brf1 subunit/transcription initiation factor TFIIB
LGVPTPTPHLSFVFFFNSKPLTFPSTAERDGDIRCECNYVLQSAMLDDRPEWVNYAADAGKDKDQSRVGPAQGGSFLSTQTLSTQIGSLVSDTGKRSSVLGDISTARALQRKQNRATLSSGDRIQDNANRHISELCRTLRLTKALAVDAQAIHKRLLEATNQSIRGRNAQHLCAACILLALRMKSQSKPLPKTIAAAAHCTVRELSKSRKHILEKVDTLLTEMPPQSGADFSDEICDALRLPFPLRRASATAIKAAENLGAGSGRRPRSRAAVIIYMLALLGPEESRRSGERVSEASGVNSATLRKAYSEIFPHAEEILRELAEKSEDDPNAWKPDLSHESLPESFEAH